MRYNTFYQVHKALRAMLYETAIELQQTDFNNEDQAVSLLNNIASVIDPFYKHSYNEDHYVFAAVPEHEPSVIDSFAQEHVKDHALGGKLRTLINMYSSSEGEEERTQLGSAIRKAFVEFLSSNLDHMAKEEEIINNVLWRYYTDDQIRAIERKIVASQTPESAAIVWKWMLRGLSNNEISNWLKLVEKTAPGPVFNYLIAAAEGELPAFRFQKVSDRLTEGKMIA